VTLPTVETPVDPETRSDDATEPARERSLIEAARRDAETLRGSGVHSRAELSPLPTLPGYRVEGEVHRGAQGVVYRATRLSDGSRVAIKVMRRRGASASERARSEREIQLLRQIHHPGIVAIDDWGSTADGGFHVMEYIDGLPLDEHVEQAELPREERLRLFARVCEAVHAAHLHGVIHRDLKPSNIRVRPDGTPVVLDFGLAKDSSRTETVLTGTGQFVGSLPWASPEQASAAGPLADVRSDVYSLGVILYQLLAGRFPYPTDGPIRETLEAILHADPQPLGDLVPPIDENLATVVATALRKDPARRYQSAAELAREIERCLAGDPIEAKRDNALAAMRRRLRRHRLAAGFGTALIVVLAAATVAIGILYRDQQRLRRTAELDATDARTIQRFLETILTSIETRPEHEGAVTVSELVADATRRLEGAGLRPEIEASLRTTLGESLLWVGRPEEARAQIERALALGRSGEIPDARTAHRLHQLGLAHQQLGVYDQAERRYAEAARAADLAPEMPASAHVSLLRSFALFELARDRADSCASLLDRADAVAAALSPEDELRVRLLLDRGQLHLRRGEIAASEQAFRRALERASALPAGSAALRHSAEGHLATALIELARPDEAEPLLRSALAYREEAFGAGHEHTLQTRHALSILYLRTGRSEEAEELARATIAGYEALNGAGHPRTLQVKLNLARILEATARIDAAAACYAECLAGLRAALGDRHIECGFCADELGRLLLRSGRTADAEAPLRLALDALRAGGPQWHAAALRSGGDLALALRSLGRPRECADVLQEIIAADSEISGAGSLDLLGFRQNLAGVQEELGDPAAAAATLEAVIAGLREHHPERRLDIAHSLGRLGLLEMRRGDRTAGVARLLESRAILRELPSAEAAPLLGAVLEALAEHYRLADDAERTAEVRAELEALRGTPAAPAE